MGRSVPECPLHATWVCTACAHRRAYLDRRWTDPFCVRCGGTTGTLLPVHHHEIRVYEECATEMQANPRAFDKRIPLTEVDRRTLALALALRTSAKRFAVCMDGSMARDCDQGQRNRFANWAAEEARTIEKIVRNWMKEN